MDETRFRALLEAYGGDPARWPAVERAAALAFVAAQGGAAARLMAEARALDAVLDQAPSHTVDAALMGRVLAAAPQPSAGWRERARRALDAARGRLGGARARFAAGVAAALLVSVGVGYGVGAAQATRDVGGALIDVAFTSAYTGFRFDG